jgi:NitT/TauT family transport system substrate-binding protein
MSQLDRRLFIAGLAGTGLVASPALIRSARAADKVSLLLNWYLYGEHAPFFYGKKLGLFAAEGIDLDIQEGRGSAVTLQAVAAKSVPFGYSDMSAVVRGAVRGAPVASTGVLLQKNPASAMGFAEKNIRTAADLKGKTVATTPGDALSQVWPAFLKKANLKESDVRILAGDAQTKLNAVISGQADVLLGYSHDQSMKIKDATGKAVFPIMFSDYGLNSVATGIIAHRDTLTGSPDLVRRFMKAATLSAEAAEKAPGAAADAMLEADPKAGKKDTLTEGFTISAGLYRLTPDQRPFATNAKAVADTVDILVEYGGVDPSAKQKVATYFTNDFLPGRAS